MSSSKIKFISSIISVNREEEGTIKSDISGRVGIVTGGTIVEEESVVDVL